MASGAYASQPPTEAMMAAGFSFGDVVDFAQKAIDEIQEHGDSAVDILRTTFRLWQHVAGRDFAGIMIELNKVVVDTGALIAAIRAEFGL